MRVARLAAIVPLLTGVLGAATGCAGAARHDVVIADLEFTPRQIVVAVGDTVVWTNRDVVPHTVTLPGDAGDGDEIGAGRTIRRVMTRADTVHYRCRYHPGMTGTVVVR
ncbi:MAG: plastocyanin/azurin family copper-binding protein [Gemmatimonadales bacterium]